MDLLSALPSWADVAGLVREVGPVAALLVLAWLAQTRQNAAAQRAQVEQNRTLLDGLLGGLREVREAQAEVGAQQAAAVAELRGIRADLVRTETTMTRLAERQGEHGETLAAHGARLQDHARRLATLEGHLPPAGVPTTLRRPRADERS